MENYFLDFKTNENSFKLNEEIETICLYGSPNNVLNPILTICIPTYKRPDLLKRAIDSALNQNTDLPFLVYVVDNEDNFLETETYTLIKKYSDPRLVYFKNKKNLGMGGNWNRCGEIVETEYFSLLHDDDTLLPSYINDIYVYLRNKKFDFIFMGYKQSGNPFYENKFENVKRNKCKQLIKSILTRKVSKVSFSDNIFLDNICGAPTCGILIRKKTFLSSGGFNMKNYPSLDWFYFLYVIKKFNCIKLNKVCGIYFWEQNASLKKEVLDGFLKQREQVILSLGRINLSCKFYFKIFKKEFIKKINTPLEMEFKSSSFLYRLILKMKLLKYQSK